MNTGSALAIFTITLSQAVTEPVQVEWFTSDGTAKAGVDYAANKGTVIFSPGQTSKTVDILVYGRAVGSENRSFYVEMLPPTNAILGASIGECIITVDTSGSTPVTQIIIPTGPVGPQGDSAYQSYLNTTTDNPPMTEAEWVESLKGDPAEIAEEVAPLIDVGNTVLTAEGTESLSHPDSTTVKAVARRVAYASPAKIATVTLADGQNTIPASSLVGDAVDFYAAGFVPRIYRTGPMFEPLWSINTAGELVIESAVAGDLLYAVQYGTGSEKRPFAAKADFDTLKNNISSIDGAAYIGNAAGVYDAVMHIDATHMRDGMIIYAKGRDTVRDGGGGWFEYRKTSTETVDGGIIFQPSTGTGRLVRIVQTDNSEKSVITSYNVRWWGAKGDGAVDDTAAILAAYNYCKNTVLFFNLRFPVGRYVTLTSFVFNDVTNCSFLMEGATFIGGSNGADNSQLAVFEIRNAVAGSISGPWFITTKPQSGPVINNPNAYQSGYLARGVPGGALNPSAGIVAFFSVSDLTTIRIGNGIKVGEIGNDAQTSEMQFINCKTPFTVNPVYVAGSQTLVSFEGCTLASNTVAGITNALESAIINDGGCVSVQGGSVEQHSNSATQMILMGPCFSALYGNPYGQVHISGAVIETIAPVCNITNRYGYATPASYLSSLTIEGCTGGYLGAMPGDVAPVNVYDTTYAGVITIPDGSMFYAAPSAPARTGYNVNASGNNKVRIAVGKTVFDTATGFKAWQAGIYGGIMIHDEVMATAAKVTSQTVPSGAMTTIVWGSNPTDNVRMGRYQYMVNTANGIITVPDAGIKSIRIEASALLDAPSITGNIILYRGGTQYHYGVIGGGVGSLNITIPDPVAGEQMTIRTILSAASSLTPISKMNIFLTT